METSTGHAVTLEAFAARVGCHFTTASRLRAGHRMPGRRLLRRIVEGYGLDREEAFRIFTEGTPEQFGEYLRDRIFEAATDSTDETGEDAHDVSHRAA
jgi:transcriptional regulator with XRE-family HTH domain